MAKILTQDEIDALLTTVGSSESELESSSYEDDKSRSVVAYDFKHPNRVSKDQIRTLENMHDNLAGHLGSALSSMLRTIVDVDLVSVDQITYTEFIMSLVSPSCTYTFAAPPLEGVCLVDFNPTLTFSIIDRMFGGHGKTMETERELTGIERSVMSTLVQRLYNELTKTWEHLVEIEIEQKSFETNPQFIQIVPPGETVVVTSLQVKLFQASGLLTICYPYVSLEPIVTSLSAQNWIDATKKKNVDGDLATNVDNLQRVSAEVAAILDKIETDNTSVIIAQPGLSAKNRAVQILEAPDNIVEEMINDR